jgi:hypothetical protein
MWKRTVYLLAINFVVVAIAVAIYAFGYEHDRSNHLYQELLTYDDLSIGVYGRRWARISQAMIAILIVGDFVVGYILYINRPCGPSTVINEPK